MKHRDTEVTERRNFLGAAIGCALLGVLRVVEPVRSRLIRVPRTISGANKRRFFRSATEADRAIVSLEQKYMRLEERCLA